MVRKKPSARTRLITILSIGLGLHLFTLGGPTAALAQQGAAGPLVTQAQEAGGPATAALREAEAAAARAERVAQEARALAESLAEEAAEEARILAESRAAKAAAEKARILAEARATVAAEEARVLTEARAAAAAEEARISAGSPAERARPEALEEVQAAENWTSSQSDLEDAVERAEAAADEAWVAARAAERASRDREHANETGPYLGAAFVYGAEEFDDDIVIKSSLGAAGFVGWRFNSHVAAELRYTAFDGFDIKAANGNAEIDGFAATLNAKVYPIRTRIQPFVVLGLGALHLEQDTRLNNGRRFRAEETDVVFRVGAGVDLPLSEFLSLNLEAAYLAPADNLSDFDITSFSTGITYQF